MEGVLPGEAALFCYNSAIYSGGMLIVPVHLQYE